MTFTRDIHMMQDFCCFVKNIVVQVNSDYYCRLLSLYPLIAHKQLLTDSRC
jgi:hypothetical protein